MKRLSVLVSLVLAPAALWACEKCVTGMGGAGMSGSHKYLILPFTLGSLALGYFILRSVRKDKETGWFRWAGLGAGWIIVIVSLVGLACSLCSTCGKGKRVCDMSEKAATMKNCPMHEQMPAATPHAK
ncbi:MAG: hypothetical protein AABZ44_02440 [Elusimicrobiota bacterium]